MNAGRPADQEAVQRLNQALGPVSAHLHIDAGGASLSAPSGGLDAGLAAIAQTVLQSSADGTWARLKACRAETCRWAFYDRSKNRSGAWCTMAVCGSRMKVRAYRGATPRSRRQVAQVRLRSRSRNGSGRHRRADPSPRPPSTDHSIHSREPSVAYRRSTLASATICLSVGDQQVLVARPT